MTLETVQPDNPAAIAAVKELWSEYWQSLGFSPDFQSFAEELRTIPGKYAPPAGRLLLLRVDGDAAGTAAFRPLDEHSCEAKRLYVRPAYRGRGAARALLAGLIDQARNCGYRHMYGDTLPAMLPAMALYREQGFLPTGPYSDDPTPGAIYLRLDLKG